MTENVRYWERVGMYVTEDFAQEWIKRLGDAESSDHGKYLDSETEEYVPRQLPTESELKREVKDLFEGEFEEVELPAETRAIVLAQEMEKNKVQRIKELKASGMELQDAKDKYQEELDLVITDTLGLEPGALAITMGGETGIPEGAFGEDAETDEESEDAPDDGQED